MAEVTDPRLREARRRLAAFRRGEIPERLFVEPIPHPSEPTGFCFCGGSPARIAAFWLKAAVLRLALAVPWSALKVWTLRRLGARIGERVYFSYGVWIDPTFPELIEIEDGVFFGMGARIFNHEYRIDEFRAGRATIRRGAFIGGFAVIGPGVEIGAGAVVAAFTVADRDVPAGATLIASPCRILRRTAAAGDPGSAGDPPAASPPIPGGGPP